MADVVDLSAPGLREAVAKAAEWRLIGLLLERPRPERRARILELAAEAGDGELRELAGRLAGLEEPDYVSLFGPGGPVSPREVAYRRVEDPGWIMADAAAFYEAFGYRPDAEDPVDHMAVLIGFVAYLGLKEAYALASGLDAEVAATARARFLASHVAPLASGLAAKLELVEAPDLRALALLLAARAGAPLQALPPDAPDDEGELSCGPCAAPPPPVG